MSGMMPPPYASGPWMQFFNGTPMPQMRSQSLPMSGTPRSFSFEIPSSEASGESKRVAREKDEEVSSPSKKLNETVKLKKAGNIMWDDELDDFLIPFLANEARNGGKCDKRIANEVIYLDLPVKNDSSPIQVGSSTEAKANKTKNAKTKVRIDKSSRANKRHLV
ncbi:uncharacterized protein A4U43_UnF3810 [Asparagus officinalis]|uniref:Uncharacterized protein n=1 Tax=Asparagus officinalis TaxID=4686 RepID=A0A1R3L6Z8_ASPOF|nr:uncharacterized protein A4U43_UnF3810 [Asparagus officinalis]